MARFLTLPFRLAWIPIAWFLRLLGFGAGVKRRSWEPPAADTEHHVWAVVLARRENQRNDPVVRLRPDRGARRAARRRSSVLSSATGKVLVPVAAVLAVAIATVGALAYYTASGTGSASASVGTLNPPTGVTTLPSGSTVTVSWTAPSGGVAPQGYYVQRYLGSTPSPACGTSPSILTTPSSAITCSDTGVTAGTYTYTVTAVYNSWTATSSAGAPVTVTGLATKLVFTTTAQTLTAGVTSGSITVQRQDASGTPAMTATTTVNLSTSSTGAVFRDATDSSTITSVTIGPGASTATVKYKDTVAAHPSVTAADAAAVLTSATQVETVNAAGANKLVYTTPPVGNVTEGTSFSASPAVSIEDTFGNVVTTDTGNVTLAVTSYSAGGGGMTQGSLACTSTLTVAAVSGVAHFAGCQITGSMAAGTYTLSATRSGLTTATSGNVTINAGTASAAQTTLTPTGPSIVANGTSTQVLTVQARDANGNNLSTGGAGVTITKSSGTGTIGTVADQANGTYTATVTSPTAAGSGIFVATLGGSNVLSGGGSPTQATVTYLAGAVSAAKSTLTPTSSSIAANGVSTQVLIVQARDANGNNLSTGGATVTITKSSGTGTISSVTDNGTGTYTATVTSPTTAGSGIFVATIGGSAVQSGGGAQAQATVSYSTAASAAHVQDAAFTGSGAALTSVSPSLSSPPTSGDTLIVFVGDDGSGGATVSGVSGGGVPTWTRATSVIGSGATGNGNNNNGELEIWYGVVNCSGACGAANEAVTVSLSATTNVQMATVSEWSGIVTSSPLDSAASLAVASRSGTSFATSPLTPTRTGDLVVSSAWVDNKNAGVTTAQNATSGYTQLDQTNATGSFYRGYDAYQFDSSTNPIGATWPNPDSNSYAWAIAAFKTNAVPDTTPPTGVITAPATGAAVHGTVTVSSNSADTASGVASAQFQYSPHGANTWTTIGTDATGPYSSPWNTPGLPAGLYDLRVITTDNATNSFTSTPLVTVTVDNTAPTGSVAYGSGYNTSGTVPVTFSASDSGSGLSSTAGQLSRASAPLSNGSCGVFGAFAPVGPAGVASPYSDAGVGTGNCYEYEYVVSDNAGNVATITSASVVKVDKAGPTNSLALTGQTGGASYLSGTTIYYQGSSAGSFQIQNTVGDTASGPASSQFGSLGGSVANWTFAGSIVSSPAGGPYVSSGFSWVSGTTGSATEVVTGADAAGNTTAAPTITLANDTTAPSGGSVTANGGAVMSWVKSASIPVSFSAGTDGGSGVNGSSGRLLRGSSAYNAASATCGAISSFSSQVGATGLGSPVTDTSGLSAGNCYAYEYQVADNVGNVQTYGPSAAVAFDNTVPAVTVTNAAGQAAATGSLPITFTVTFSEPVLGFAAGDLTRTGTSTGGNVALSGAGPVYTVTVTNPGNDLSNGTIGFSIAAGGVTDNALNNNTGSTGSPDSVAYDASPPLTTFTFPGSSAYGSAAYAAGCTPVGICGNATDLSGVAAVRVSVRRSGDGDYWNGSTFINSPSELFNTAALTSAGATATAWNLAMPQPGDGSYVVHVQAKDTLGNDSAPADTSSETFSIKSQAPAAPGSVALANGQGVGAAYINNSTKGVVSVTVSGIAEINPGDTITVTISDGTHQVTGTAPATSGSVTVTGINAASLNDGLDNIVVGATETDQANNTSGTRTASTNYSKDVVAPDAPTAVAISNGGGTGNAFINLSDQTSVSYLVTIPSGANNQSSDTVAVALTGGGTVSGTKTPSNPGGTVTVSGIDAHTLSDGTVNVSATATDQAGNVSSAKTATTPKDTVAPAAPTSVVLANGGGSGSVFINNANKGSVNYTVALGSGSSSSDTVTFSAHDTGSAHGVGPLTAGGSAGAGNVSFNGNVLTLFVDGTVTASATATDPAGNTSAVTSTMNTKDVVAPDAPTAVAISNGGGTGNAFINNANKGSVNYTVALGSGSSSSDTITFNAHDSSTHSVGPLTTPGSPGAGNANFNANNLAAFVDGAVSATATATDLAGNTSTATSTTNTKDTVAPAAPTSVVLANGGGSGSVFINNANKGSVNYTVALGSGSSSSDTVTFSAHDTGSAHGVGPLTAGGSAGAGNVSFNGNVLTLFVDGTVTASATATDPAGNTSAVTSTTNTKDVVAPDAPTAVAISNGGGTGNAFINSSDQTSVSYLVTIPSGANNQSSDTVAVALTGGGTVSGTKTPSNPGGTVTVSGIDAHTLSDGTVNVSATATDQAGNVSSAKTATTPKDTVAPAAPTSVVLANGGGSGSVFINNANKGSVNYTVALGSGSSSSDTVTFSAHDTGSAHGVGPLTAGGSAGAGNVSFNGNVLTLFVDGTVTASATATDPAGNTSAVTSTMNTKDVVAPDAPTAVAISNGGGTGNAFINSSDQTSVSYLVTIPSGANNQSSDTVAVALTGGGTVSGTKTPSNPGGTVTVSGIDAHTLSDGTVNVSATATDQAGNVSSAKTATTPKDTVAPTLSVSLTALTGGNQTAGLSGSSIFFQDDVAGGFRLVATLTDSGGSGAASAAYPAIAATRFAHTNETITSPAAGPFTSSNFNITGSGGNHAAAPGPFTVTASDRAGNSVQQAFTFTADDAAPTPASLSIANKPGGAAGMPEAGDTLTVVFSEALSVSSLCSAWSGNATNQSLTNVSLSITNGGGAGTNDSLDTITSASCSGGGNWGSIDLGNSGYVTTTRTFSNSTVAYDATTFTLTITLGAPSGGTGTVAAAATATYTPDTGITDVPGNTATGTRADNAVHF